MSATETTMATTTAATMALTDAGIAIASMGEGLVDPHPGEWFGPVPWSIRAGWLKGKYGYAKAMPGKWGEVPREVKVLLEPEVLEQCRELPRLDYWKNDDHRHLVCGGRLVEIFKEESREPLNRGGLGVESYAVLFEPAKRGYRSVLAHALKYTQKLPASTPKGLARLEHVLEGTRRIALLGAHYGVPIESPKCNPRCRTCGAEMVRVKGLGLVPLSEVEDLPDVGEDAREEKQELREVFGDEEVRGP